MSDYIFDLGKDQDGNEMPNPFGITPVNIDSADDEISIGRFLNSMEMFLDNPEEGLCGEDHYKLTALLRSLEDGYHEALRRNQIAFDLAVKVLDGEVLVQHLSDEQVLAVHRWFEQDECALPPAGQVAEEVQIRRLVAE